MGYLIKKWLGLALWLQVLFALLLGSITGLLLGKDTVYLQPVGTLFIHAVKMMIVPVVFVAIVSAVLSMDDLGKMRRLVSKAGLLYFCCMLIATSIGILVALWINPGHGFHPAELISQSNLPAQSTSMKNIIVNIVPSNPVQAFAESNVLQILVFALIFGIAINLAGEPAQPVRNFFKALSPVVFKLAHMIMKTAPYGIFALIACTFGSIGVTAFVPLAMFVLTVYLACLINIFVFYSFLLIVLAKINPFKFLKAILPAAMMAYTTSSSAATLPLSMQCAMKNLNISENMTRFLLPLGCSFNLNGLSIYLASTMIFVANIYGIHLHTGQYITMIFTIVLTAIGAAAVPSSALIVMGAIMSAVGLPLNAIGFVAGVDRLNDMMQTSTNVIGDLVSLTVVANSEPEVQHEIEPALSEKTAQ